MIRWLAHKLGIDSCPGCQSLVDYAMDGLPEGQQQKVRQHLSECPPCREQVRDYFQVREGLGLCSEQQEAPPDLCSKVLGRLREEGAGERAAPAAPLAPASARPQGWPRFWMQFGPAFAVLSLVMTLVAFGSLVSMGALANKKPAAAAPEQAAAPDNELAAISNAILSDPHAARVVLASAGPSSAASGLLVLCRGMDHAYFHCDHLSRCPLGRNYVLWMKASDGGLQRLARFTVEKDGSSVHLLQFDNAFQASGPVEFLVTQQSGEASAGPAWLKGSVSL